MEANKNISEVKAIRLRQVVDQTKIGKSKIYQMIKDGEFPAPFKAGASSLWLQSEVNAWILKKASVRG